MTLRPWTGYLVQTLQGGTWLTDVDCDTLAEANQYMDTATDLKVRIKVVGSGRKPTILDSMDEAMTTRLTCEAYRQAIIACVTAVRILAIHDLPNLRKSIDTTDAIGPVLRSHPKDTEYHQKMDEDRSIA